MDRPPIRDGYLQVAGDRIVHVGAAPPSLAPVVYDLGEVVVLPGLINAHTHLELTGYCGRLRPAPFWDWIRALIVLRDAPGQRAREEQGVRDGAWQSLRAGVTCVGDISRLNLHWPVLREIPIRKVCFVELLTLADDPPRNQAELRAALDTVEEDMLLTVGITPHAPYSVPAGEIRAALAEAHARGRPWTMHWCETPEEIGFITHGHERLPEWVRGALRRHEVHTPRCAPAKYLEQLTGAAAPGLLAHVNYAEDDALAALAQRGHSVAYCPRAHRFFGHAPHPLPRMIAAGVNVVLGTDSAASNDDLDLLAEARFVWTLYGESRARGRPRLAPARTVEAVADASPEFTLTPADVLRMVTVNAARALALEAQIGSLTPGKQADVIAVPLTVRDVTPELALLTNAAAPSAVWVAGRRVV